MAVQTRTVSLQTRGRGHIVDVTPPVARVLRESGLREGIVTVFVSGSTACVTTMEHEPGLVKDMAEAFERLAPWGRDYAHNRTGGDGNGASHVRASLLGPGVTVPFSGGRLMLGTWQQIVLVDMDARPRSREVVVQVLGE